MRYKNIIIITLVLCLFICLLGCNSTTYIDGNEWLEIQEQCLVDLKAYTDGMDEVYTLYIIGSIGKEDFANELSLLQTQYNLLVRFYDELKAEHPLKENGHSYISKAGTEAMETAYASLGKLFASVYAADGSLKDPAEVSYIYLAVREEYESAIRDYLFDLAALEAVKDYKTKESETRP